MRNLTLAVATLASAFALLHCAGGSSDGGGPATDDKPSTSTSDAGVTPPKPPKTTPVPDGGKTIADAAGAADSAPPTKGAKDAGGNPAATGPGPSCTALSACCGKLSNSLEQVGCLIASGKKNELVCDGALVTFNCAAANNPGHGPSCLGLIPFIKYCGGDGPKGDANTLYECNTSGNISIVRQCPNGCQTNFGVDDSCVAAPPGGGGGGGGGDSANCKGYSGMFCGADGVGGNPNTLYDCENDAIASKQVCANGCVTNPDATLNDYCADAPPAGGGGGSSGPSCSGLPDYKYCGNDGVNGDASTLYTCAGGKVTSTTPCANGCTIGATNADDYCTSGGGTGGGSTADCFGLSDGTYCGSNGPMGDPDTAYTCSGGSVASSEYCSAGCYVSTINGNDSCF